VVTSTTLASATVSQVEAVQVAVAMTPDPIGPKGQAATVTATVTDRVTSAPVAADQVTFALAGNGAKPARHDTACGLLGSPSGPTNGSGQATVTYTSSGASGVCVVTAAEADTATTGALAISQGTGA
jgi:hypothetical protein